MSTTAPTAPRRVRATGARRLMAVALTLLLLPSAAGADDEGTPLWEWHSLYNSMALEAGLAVNELADDPSLSGFIKAEQWLTDLADVLDGIVPEPCYQQVHDYAGMSAESLLVGVRLARGGFGSGLGGDDGLDLHRLALRDLATAANTQLRFPNAQINAWVGVSCAG